MPNRTLQYRNQRERKTPPHIPLKVLRDALGLTLDQARELAREKGGVDLTRGALSGIENGHRGASAPTLAALEAAYGLPAGSLTTDYTPTSNTRRSAA